MVPNSNVIAYERGFDHRNFMVFHSVIPSKVKIESHDNKDVNAKPKVVWDKEVRQK
jgi:hypothetical protein